MRYTIDVGVIPGTFDYGVVIKDKDGNVVAGNVRNILADNFKAVYDRVNCRSLSYQLRKSLWGC